MLTIHHLGMSQSERIVWLCEELEIEYALKRYERRSDNRLAPDDYKALHPTNRTEAFVTDRSRRGWGMVEKKVGESPFFGGSQLTTADIMMVYCLTTSRFFRGTSLDAYPNVRAYLQRIGARPAYQRAMTRAEPGFTPMLT
jgi:glutathione S-transferase